MPIPYGTVGARSTAAPRPAVTKLRRRSFERTGARGRKEDYLFGVDFDALYEEVFPPLFRYCHRLTGDPDVAEDVAQEAFVRLLDRRVTGERPALRVWLFKVATHLIRDRWRVGENRRRLLQINPVTPGGAPDPGHEVEQGEDVASVRAALALLDPRDRELLLMREEGFSYKDMAEAVGVRSTSVGTLLARAQKRFTDAWTERAGSARGVARSGEEATRGEG